MPCNSDHMKPQTHERESKLAAELIVYAGSKLHRDVPEWIAIAADHIYGAESKINSLTVMLCELCTRMTEDEKGEIIYNGRDKDARKLANWWEAHQEADRDREVDEAEELRIKKVKKKALAKLDDDEIEALGLD